MKDKNERQNIKVENLYLATIGRKIHVGGNHTSWTPIEGYILVRKQFVNYEVPDQDIYSEIFGKSIYRLLGNYQSVLGDVCIVDASPIISDTEYISKNQAVEAMLTGKYDLVKANSRKLVPGQ